MRNSSFIFTKKKLDNSIYGKNHMPIKSMIDIECTIFKISDAHTCSKKMQFIFLNKCYENAK